MAPNFFSCNLYKSIITNGKKIQTNQTDFQLLFYAIPQKTKSGNFTIPCNGQIEAGFLSICLE